MSDRSAKKVLSLKECLVDESAMAVEIGHIEVFELIRDVCGFDKRLQGRVEGAFMDYALNADMRDLWHVLVTHDGDPNSFHTSIGNTLPYTAKRVPQKYLEAHCTFGKDTTKCPSLLDPPLYYAIEGDNLVQTKKLLERGAHPDKVGWFGSSLMMAKSKEIAKVLLEYGASVNFVDDFNNSPLSWAVRKSNVEKSKLLLEHGASPDLANGEGFLRPLLHQVFDSVGEDSSIIFELLLKHGANTETTNDGLTLLWKASKNQNPNINIIRKLLEYRADTETTYTGESTLLQESYSGRTPLLEASKYLKPNLIRILLEHGANARAVNHMGQTALHLLGTGNHQKPPLKDFAERTSLLVKHGADPNATDGNGKTALCQAIYDNECRKVEVLFKHGARAGRKEDYFLNSAIPMSSIVVFRECFFRARLRLFRGIVRFIIIARRYREDFYRDNYVSTGARLFAMRLRQLETNSETTKQRQS